MKLDERNARCPVCDPATLESNVPGIYLGGVIVAGERTNEIFIENGRFHGKADRGRPETETRRGTCMRVAFYVDRSTLSIHPDEQRRT